MKPRGDDTVFLDSHVFSELFLRRKPSLYAPDFFKPRTEELVTDDDQHGLVRCFEAAGGQARASGPQVTRLQAITEFWRGNFRF